MARRPIDQWLGFTIAVLGTAAVVALRFELNPYLGADIPFALCILPVMAAAWFGGMVAAGVAMILGAAAGAYLFLEPRYTFAILVHINLLRLVMFFIIGGILSALCSALYTSQCKLRGDRDRAVEQAATQLKLVTDHAPVAIAHCDAEHRYKFVNKPYAARFGLSPEDFVGKPLAELLGNEAFTIITPHLRDALQGKQVDVELQMPYRDQKPEFVHCRIQPETDDVGKVIGYVAVILNISDRKKVEAEHRRVEEALRLSHERLDLVVNSTELGLWYCDLPFQTLVLNDKCRQHFGLSAGPDVAITEFYRQLHPEDRDRTRLAIDKAIADRCNYDVEYRTVDAADGRLRWVRAIGKVFYDANAKPVRFDGITVEITDQKRAEQQLRENEAYFRSMADNAPAMLWVTDDSLNCTYLSKQWYEYTGRNAEQDLGFGWLENVHPDDLVTAKQTLTAANEKRAAFRMDYRLKRRDGEYRWVVSAALPRFDDHASFQGYVGCVIDVHERKIFEQALKEADRRKDEFLATLAHELRNPLAPIQNSVSVLKTRGPADDAELSWAQDVIARQVQHMSRLLDDLLDMSRITSGKLRLRMDPVELATVIGSAVETAKPYIDGATHTLEVAVPEEPILLNADGARLAQAFSNLLNNAAKYTDRGGVIRISAEREGSDAVITVRDNGIGIPAGKLAHVFDMFTQLDTSLERSQGGLGIGLTLVKSVVEMHGGKVEVRSAGLGRGSTFIVRLPVLVKRPTEHPVVPIRPVPAEQAPTGPKRRILVADDNRDAARSLSLLLKLMGNEVRTTYDGAEAAEAAAEFQPEIALLDIGMPNLNGYEAARRIREHPSGKSIYLVALTGWGQDEDKRLSREAGFDEHLVKPLAPDALQNLLAGFESARPADSLIQQ